MNGNGTKAEYAYNTNGFLTNLANKKSDGTVLSSFAYTLDASGNRLRMTENDGTYTDWFYDALYQLTRETKRTIVGIQDARGDYVDDTPVWDTSYSYDLAQNRTAMTDNLTNTATNYTYNNLNELLTAGNIAFAYDLNGNTTTKTVNNQTTSYAWSAEDKLTQITHPDTQTQTFGYDGNGVRFSATDTSGSTKFLFDGSNLVAETDAANNLTATYDYGVNGLVRQRRGADLESYYRSDGLGSTRQLTDAQQTVTDGYTYDAWGNVAIHNPQSPIANPFQYVGALGYYKEAQSGLMLLGARYYDGGVGRFWTEDPVRDGENWYVYIQSDPINRVDPEGKQSPPPPQPPPGPPWELYPLPPGVRPPRPRPTRCHHLRGRGTRTAWGSACSAGRLGYPSQPQPPSLQKHGASEEPSPHVLAGCVYGRYRSLATL